MLTAQQITEMFSRPEEADFTERELNIMSTVANMTNSHGVESLETMAATRSISITGLTKLQAAIRIATS